MEGIRVFKYKIPNDLICNTDKIINDIFSYIPRLQPENTEDGIVRGKVSFDIGLDMFQVAVLEMRLEYSLSEEEALIIDQIIQDNIV